MGERHDEAAKRARLRDLIEARSLLKGEGIRLASGATSSFYVDMKRSMFHAEAANLIAELVLARLDGLDVELVGGLEMGAVPLVAGVVQKSAQTRPEAPLAGFFVRKQAKDHGTQRLIEGLAADESLAGRRVAVLEDVTTTGESALKAVAAARAEAAEVVAVVTVVDRLQGADANLAAAGLALRAVLTRDDFGL
jgi:orotate phosphoribosyltransferase